MKRLLTALVAAVLWISVVPSAALAWEVVDRDVSFSRAVAAGWTENYDYVKFTGGHRRGGGVFRATWSVDCNGGFAFYRSRLVRDTSRRYWSDVVRIPSGQGRCRERLIVNDPGYRMLALLETR